MEVFYLIGIFHRIRFAVNIKINGVQMKSISLFSKNYQLWKGFLSL